MKLCVCSLALSTLFAGFALSAATVSVPNASFEGPVTPFADPRMDSWEDYPKPPWYDEVTNGPWDFLTGVFLNTDPSAPDHIDNMDGAQAAFLFAYPQVGIFQDYNSLDWAHPLPSHDFNALYQAGKAYQLTVGVIGAGGGMSNGVGLAAAVYYRDASSNMVIVAMTNVLNSPDVFPNRTHFIDISAMTPVVRASDPWANQNIGIAIFSTVGFELAGGYWDVDNVRLLEITPPRLSTRKAGELTVEGEPDFEYEILASSSLDEPIDSWDVIGFVTTTGGTATFTDPSPVTRQRFYVARQVP